MMMLMATTAMVMKYHYHHRIEIDEDNGGDDDDGDNENSYNKNKDGLEDMILDHQHLSSSSYNNFCWYNPNMNSTDNNTPSMKQFVGLSILWMIIPLLFHWNTSTTEITWNDGRRMMTKNQRRLSSTVMKQPRNNILHAMQHGSDYGVVVTSKKVNGISVILKGSRVDLLHKSIDSILSCRNFQRLSDKNYNDETTLSISITDIYVDWVSDEASVVTSNKLDDTFPYELMNLYNSTTNRGEEVLDVPDLEVNIRNADVLKWTTTTGNGKRRRRRGRSHQLSDDAVLLLDEHVQLSCTDLQIALREWIYDPSRVIGFDTSTIDGTTTTSTTIHGLISDDALLVHRYYYDHFHKGKQTATKYYHNYYYNHRFQTNFCRQFALSAYILSLNPQYNSPIIIETPFKPLSITTETLSSKEFLHFNSNNLSCFKDKLRTSSSGRVPSIIAVKR